MKLSIIIPALNEAGRIREAVEAAAALSPHEVIVVDGGSDDETCRIARGCDCTLLTSERGRATQQNCGARRATGDVLLFLHADCRLDPNAAGQIEHALQNPEVGAGAFRQRIEADGVLFRLLERGNALRVSCLKLPYGDQGIFVRRSLFEEAGGFPPIRLMEDLRLMRQLRRRTRIVLLPGPIHTSARRWQTQGVVRQTLRNWSLLTAEKLGVSPDRLARFYERGTGNSERGTGR